jgi:hypothetical protein
MKLFKMKPVSLRVFNNDPYDPRSFYTEGVDMFTVKAHVDEVTDHIYRKHIGRVERDIGIKHDIIMKFSQPTRMLQYGISSSNLLLPGGIDPSMVGMDLRDLYSVVGTELRSAFYFDAGFTDVSLVPICFTRETIAYLSSFSRESRTALNLYRDAEEISRSRVSLKEFIGFMGGLNEFLLETDYHPEFDNDGMYQEYQEPEEGEYREPEMGILKLVFYVSRGQLRIDAGRQQYYLQEGEDYIVNDGQYFIRDGLEEEIQEDSRNFIRYSPPQRGSNPHYLTG